MIIQAEQFRAYVMAPKGNTNNFDSQSLPPEIELLRRNDDDNDFFHITCHIDPNLKLKIKQGEYVELEKLLMKESSSAVLNNDSRLELVNRDGNMFFAPVQNRESKINSIHKWEQAFRIYAAIYTRANPK